MEISKFRAFLLDKGMVYFYATFIAGYFLLPMASGHRQLYYVLVAPAVLLLWRELLEFYRGNALAALVLLYLGYMMSSLLWTADFDAAEAMQTLGYAVSLLTFVLISGYLWTTQANRMDHLAHYAVWLAAAAALVSTVSWYLQNPFPDSRLVPLGVMHHENKASCAYGIFLLLCVHYLFNRQTRQHQAIYLLAGLALAGLVLFTQSRTALAAVSVAMLVMMGHRALGVLLLVIIGSWAALTANTEFWQERVMNLSFRPGIWEQVLADMQGHWLYGQGYLLDPNVMAYGKVFDHAHNGYLASLRDGGLPALALLLALLGTAALWAWRLNRQRGERIYLALILYGMTCIAMDFDRLIVHPKEMWLFFWLPIALVMAVYPRRDEPEQLRYHGRTA